MLRTKHYACPVSSCEETRVANHAPICPTHGRKMKERFDKSGDYTELEINRRGAALDRIVYELRRDGYLDDIDPPTLDLSPIELYLRAQWEMRGKYR
jgi:hypothetical protein